MHLYSSCTSQPVIYMLLSDAYIVLNTMFCIMFLSDIHMDNKTVLRKITLLSLFFYNSSFLTPR